jgi:sialate O-acetylesterase
MPLYKKDILFSILLLIILNCCIPFRTFANEWEQIQDLRGDWKFNIGDKIQWASPNFEDKNWETIHVPGPWENQGFHGYDGYAWYRKAFNVSAQYRGNNLYLSLGYIDDVDEVYVNGHIIGFSGSFPPHFKTSYRSYRMYFIPEEYLNFEGSNVVAVRVYDGQIEGGIIDGKVGLFINHKDFTFDVPLRGVWKFHITDNMQWREKDWDDEGWKNIVVPSKWEHQGFFGYDGWGWYRKTFHLSKKLRGEDYYLILGKIDDYDQVYVNGKLIGNTGIDINGKVSMDDESWQKFRIYFLPQEILQFDRYNTIAIRIYDKVGDGGIYTGPVGILKKSRYNDFKQRYSGNIEESIYDFFR